MAEYYPIPITALAQSDADGTDGSNIVAGAVITVQDLDGNTVIMYDDDAGSGAATSKTTSAAGQKDIYVTPGEYNVYVNGINPKRYSAGGKSALEVDTFANLELLRPVKTGQSFICQERANARYILQASGYVALPGDVTFANGRVGKLQVDDKTTIAAFGGKSDATTDDSTAASSMISRTGGFRVPKGITLISSSLSITNDNCFIDGAGCRVSTIFLNDEDGITIEHLISPGTSFLSNVSISNVSIRARIDTNSGSALHLNKCQQVYITNVILEDYYGGLLVSGGIQHEYTNFNVYSGRTDAPVSWSSLKVGSFFVKFQKASDGTPPVSIYASNCNFRRSSSSDYIENGIVINAADGLWLSNTHVMGVDNADMLVEPVNGDEQITGINLSNVWLDNNSDYGMVVTGSTTASYGRIIASNLRNLTHRANSVLIDATDFEGLRWTGGTCLKDSDASVLIRGGVTNNITGVEFAASNTSSAANKGGIVCDTGSATVNITGCDFIDTGLGVTASSMKGVRVNSSYSGVVKVTGCTFDVSDDISDESTTEHNWYSDNTSTNAKDASSVSGTTLVIPEGGNLIHVTAALSFNNLSGRQDGRVVTLYFEAACTVTNGSIQLDGGVTFNAVAGDTLTLVKINGASTWQEIGRKV